MTLARAVLLLVPTLLLAPAAGAQSLSIANATVAEGNAGTAGASFTVTLTPASGSSVTVLYQTGSAGTAASGVDYLASSGTLTLAPGVTSVVAVVPATGDALDEPDETFFVNLRGASGATIADAQAQGTILDDDPLPTLRFVGGPAGNGDRVVTEGNTATVNSTFQVALSVASGKTVKVQFATGASGSATTAVDYAAKTGSLTFAAGELLKSFAVQVLGDTAEEVDESFYVNLSGAQGATIVDTQAQGTIVDNDPPPAGSPAVSIGDVTLAEGNGGSVNAAFIVTLSGPGASTITVPYATGTGGTAAAGPDYVPKNGALTFTPGQTMKVVNVSVVGDAFGEADEVFYLNLTSAAFASIADGQGRGTILNDDTAVQVSVNPTNPSTGPAGTIGFSATVTNASDAGVTWSVQAGTATGSIVSTGPANATFTAGTAGGTCTVTATSVADPTKSAAASVTVVVPSGFAVSPASAAVAPGTQQQFFATLDGEATGATWDLPDGETAGTITASGLFTAGSTVGTFQVVGTSTVDPGQTATAEVTVATDVSIEIIGPVDPAITTADVVTFYASVSPSGINPAVTWTTGPGAESGEVIPIDWFRGYEPPAPGTFTVTGTSDADPSQTDSFTVTVSAAPGDAFVATGEPTSARYLHATATMSDGRVVLVGGRPDRQGPEELLDSTVFDPTTMTFSAGPPLGLTRILSRAIALDADRVLVTGGNETYDMARTTGEILTLSTASTAPATNTMSVRRIDHEMLRLTTGPNAGRVLVLGGFNGPRPYGLPTWQATTVAELFDPATDAFSTLPAAMQAARGLFSATLLSDGRILIVGGIDPAQGTLASAEIYDPVAGTFAFTGTLASPRFGHTATLLADGRVLIAGGTSDLAVGTSAEIYSPATGLFTATTGSMAVARMHASAVRTPTGQVLVVGGQSGDHWLRGTVEEYRPGLGTFALVGHMAMPRTAPTAVLLSSGPSSGKVLVVGGGPTAAVTGVAEVSP